MKTKKLKNYKSYVKLYVLLSTFTFFTFNCFSQSGVSINITGTVADNSAMLDVNSASKGILIPRVTLLSTSDVVTIPSPAVSLLVYNTNVAMTGGNVGFWYWDGIQWVQAIGPQGPAGATGSQGPIGLTGATGPQGPIGLTGANGTTVLPGIGSTSAKIRITGGELYQDLNTGSGSGIIIKSPNGNCWKISVDDTGNVTTQSITCPL